MAIEIFNRHELKYVITNQTYQKIRKELDKYMELDFYNQNNQLYSIHNLYLDTIDNQLIRQSLSKPKYKEKLRLRSYNGFNNQDDIVFLEIKKKYKGMVNKRRTEIVLGDAINFINSKEIPKIKEYMNRQIMNELAYTIQRKQYYPKTYIFYKRVAYFNKDAHDVRITFDRNIIAKRDQQKPVLLLDSNLWLMEIKVENSVPLWIAQLLSKYHVYRQSFSKYGIEYLNFIEKETINLSIKEKQYA